MIGKFVAMTSMRKQRSLISIVQPSPKNATALFTKERDKGATVWSGNVSSITICMVHFIILVNTFVSREEIMFARGFVLKSDWLLLNL